MPLIDTQIDINSAPNRCGFQIPFWVTVNNFGSLETNTHVYLKIDSSVEIITGTLVPQADSIINNIIYWPKDSLSARESAFYYFEALMPDFNSNGIKLDYLANVNIGDSLDIITYDYSRVLSCAIDPNDKLVNPKGYSDEGYVLLDQVLEYTLRFQNTGTDTAFNVRVTDRINPNLDINTFKLIGVSHPVITRILENNTLEFLFNDILLPDSTINEIGSHGFVKFSIEADSTINDDTNVLNRAEIYFDFNDPIVTEYVSNRFVNQIPYDLDNDGFDIFSDCDDSNANVNPNQPEIPYNQLDDDCDEFTFDDDLDQDGFLLETDCNDEDANINPDAIEIPNNGIDENCDGLDSLNSTIDLILKSVNIFPNPISKKEKLIIEADDNLIIEIYNTSGSQIKLSSKKTVHDLQEFSTGIYFIHFIHPESGIRLTKRLLIY